MRVDLPSGITEVLITSLIDEEEYPSSIFADLYHQRWGIEEDYKVMKSRLNIENFSGMSVEAVLQDIYAKNLTKNLVSVAVFEAEIAANITSKKRKHRYKINVHHALSQFKDNVVRFMMKIAIKGLSQLMINKMSQVTNAYRENRKCDRSEKCMSKNKYPTAYKRMY